MLSKNKDKRPDLKSIILEFEEIFFKILSNVSTYDSYSEY